MRHLSNISKKLLGIIDNQINPMNEVWIGDINKKHQENKCRVIVKKLNISIEHRSGEKFTEWTPWVYSNASHLQRKKFCLISDVCQDDNQIEIKNRIDYNIKLLNLHKGRQHKSPTLGNRARDYGIDRIEINLSAPPIIDNPTIIYTDSGIIYSTSTLFTDVWSIDHSIRLKSAGFARKFCSKNTLRGTICGTPLFRWNGMEGPICISKSGLISDLFIRSICATFQASKGDYFFIDNDQFPVFTAPSVGNFSHPYYYFELPFDKGKCLLDGTITLAVICSVPRPLPHFEVNQLGGYKFELYRPGMWEKWSYSCMFYKVLRGQTIGFMEDGVCLEKCANDSDCVTVALTKKMGQKFRKCQISNVYCDVNKTDNWIPQSIHEYIYVKTSPFCKEALNINKALTAYFEETSGLCYFILLKRKGNELNKACSKFGTFVARVSNITIESLTKDKIWLGIVKKGEKLGWMDDEKWSTNYGIPDVEFSINTTAKTIASTNNTNSKECFIGENGSIFPVDCNEIHDVVCVYPLFGEWGKWSSWSYAKGTRSRNKMCDSPKPLINNIPSVLRQKYRDSIVRGCLSKMKESVEEINVIGDELAIMESKDIRISDSKSKLYDYDKSDQIPRKICFEIVDYSTGFEECQELCTKSSDCTAFVHSPNGKSGCAIDLINCQRNKISINSKEVYLKSALFCKNIEANIPQRWLYDNISDTCFTIIGFTTANEAFHKCHQLKSHLLKLDYRNDITSSFQDNIFRFIKGEDVWLGLRKTQINGTFKWQSKFWPDYFTFDSTSVLQLSGNISDIFVQRIFVQKYLPSFVKVNIIPMLNLLL
ncbi:DgyrCDS11334 [Dimorphilus gyrociliatus]|uniref:DgyrCDS11334 n=1 Tax=Dimorphilus gyrociliatus TaxID=2664684 RepID=A0A7I8W2Z6_9ANNE|nr:DgyrCDS11334 [Dimorphilus gyrociliatus]